MAAIALRNLIGSRPPPSSPAKNGARTGGGSIPPPRAISLPTADLFSSSAESLFPVSSRRKSRPVFCFPKEAGESGQLGGNQHSKYSASLKSLIWAQPFLDFAGTNFLPLALLSGISLGLLNPTFGCLAHKYYLSRFSTCGIFFISGLMLRSTELGAALEAWPAGLFGLGSILLFTPFISRLILQIQLAPHELVTGLAVFCCMPTTLSSGVALTHLAGGNSALALAMTLVSNLLGIVIVPFSLSKLIGAGAGVSVPTSQLFKSLIITLLIPLILGKVIRDYSKFIAEYSDRNRRFFSMTSAALLSLVPWMQVSRSRSLLLTVNPAVFAIAISMGMLLHLVLLMFNTIAVKSLSLISGENSTSSGSCCRAASGSTW